MDEKTKRTLIYFIIAILLCGTLGFLIGRKTVNLDNPKTEVKYVKGEKVTDSIPFPQPIEVVKPIDTANIIKQCVKNGIYYELFPEKTITEYIEITKEDTTAIIKDWATKRMYSETLFDIDTVGKCVVNASVQYNRLSLLAYDYTPIHKEVSITTNKVRLFSPYIGIGVLVDNDFKDYLNYMPTASLGFFIKEKYGVNLQYGKSFKTKNNFFGASLLYKF